MIIGGLSKTGPVHQTYGKPWRLDLGNSCCTPLYEEDTSYWCPETICFDASFPDLFLRADLGERSTLAHPEHVLILYADTWPITKG